MNEPILPSAAVEHAQSPSTADDSLSTRQIYRTILRTGLPSVIGFVSLHLYSVVNMFWVSRLGPEPMAGLAIFAAFYWVISSVNQIAGVGSVAVISRRYGERDLPRTQTAIVEAFVLKIITALVFAVIGWLLTPTIVTMLGAKGPVADYAVRYGRVMFLGLAANFPCWTLFTALRSINHPRYAMAIMIASTIFNAILDPFLIFGWWGFPKLGVAGAAWGSNIGLALTVTVGLVMFFSGAFQIRLDWASVRRSHFSTMWQMFKIGLPSGISSTSYSLAQMVIMPLIAGLGTPVVAVYGAGMRVLELIIVAAVGLELGMSPLVGHALGAHDKIRAWKIAEKAAILGFVLMLVLGVVVAALGLPLTRIFLTGEPYESLGTAFFRILAFSLPFIGLYILIEGAFTGSGDTVPTMVVGIIHAWVFRVPLMWLLVETLNWGATGAWWGYVASEIISASIFLWWFSRKKWLERVV